MQIVVGDRKSSFRVRRQIVEAMSKGRDRDAMVSGASRTLNSKEIARLAGVSQATVSRVLSGHQHVAEATRSRVMAVVDEHGYVPNVLARNLVMQRSDTIGLVVSNITNQFYPELIEAVCDLAARHNLNVILGNIGQSPERQRDYLRLLIEQRVAGVLLTSAMMKSPYVVELVRKRYPIVLVNRQLSGVRSDLVVIDNEDGARKAVRHLLALGHARIAYIGGLAGTSTNRDRERGYRAALREADLPVDPALIFPGDYTVATAKMAARKAMSLVDRPTAALCADDGIAFGFIDGLIDVGCAVPADCAVIGFDDVSAASHRLIGLTSVRQPTKHMAELAMTLLLDRINGTGPEKPRQIVLPAELIVRRTCGSACRPRSAAVTL